jgi:hypothetical protein
MAIQAVALEAFKGKVTLDNSLMSVGQASTTTSGLIRHLQNAIKATAVAALVSLAVVQPAAADGILSGVGQVFGFQPQYQQPYYAGEGQPIDYARAYQEAGRLMRAKAIADTENSIAQALIATYGNHEISPYAAHQVERRSEVAAGIVGAMIDQDPRNIINPGQTDVNAERLAIQQIVPADLASVGAPTDPRSVAIMIERAKEFALQDTRQNGQLQMQYGEIFSPAVAHYIISARQARKVSPGVGNWFGGSAPAAEPWVDINPQDRQGSAQVQAENRPQQPGVPTNSITESNGPIPLNN